MLLTLFILFLVISIVFIVISLAFNQALFGIIGFVMLFSLGINLVNEPLQYKVGEDLALQYGSNLTNAWSSEGGSVPSNVDPYVFNTNTTNIYAYYDDGASNRFGWGMSMVGVLGFCVVLFTMI
jgi:hypothetical protein